VSRGLTFTRLCLTIFVAYVPLGALALLWHQFRGPAPAMMTWLHMIPIAVVQIVVSWRLRDAPLRRDLLAAGVVALLGLALMTAGLFTGTLLALVAPWPLSNPDLVPVLMLYVGAGTWAARRGVSTWRAACPSVSSRRRVLDACPESVGPGLYGAAARRQV
jgi:hypothetical protein